MSAWTTWVRLPSFIEMQKWRHTYAYSLVWSQEQFPWKLQRTSALARKSVWQQCDASSIEAANLVCSCQTTDPISWEQESRSDEDHSWWSATSKISYWTSVEWNFNPPSAPHFGGVLQRLIERIVQCVRRALLLKLGSAKLTPDVFTTIVSEAECLINSRPITHVRSHHEDDNPPTPNHFWLGRPFCDVPGPFSTRQLHWRIRHGQRWSRDFSRFGRGC